MARETEARLTIAQARIVLMPSRIRILRALAEKRSTATEISKRTGIANSTVRKHLGVLQKHRLVQRHEEDRLWIYYDLTPPGRAVGKLDPLRILVLFTLAAGAGLIAAGAWTWWRGGQLRATERPWEIPPIGVDPVEPTARASAYLLAAGGILVILVAGWAWRAARLPPVSPTDTSRSP